MGTTKLVFIEIDALFEQQNNNLMLSNFFVFILVW